MGRMLVRSTSHSELGPHPIGNSLTPLSASPFTIRNALDRALSHIARTPSVVSQLDTFPRFAGAQSKNTAQSHLRV